jgi:Na+/phosphate symporter
VVAALLPALVAVAGALVYALATNPKLSEMGRLMFGCGLLVCCFIAARTTLHLP